MTPRNARLSLLAATIAGVLSQAQAYAAPAETANANAAELGEIVVTARQREEKLTDVPVTIQAFTAGDIQAAGIERPQDFIALTSGVSQVQTAEVGDMQVSIRGINTGRDAETNFALVIDGVLQTNPNAFNQEFANVQQIEVLKGPQGALYGRNAVAGAMIITTKKPTDAFEADVNVGGGNKGLKKASIYLAGPITEGVDAGLGAYYRKTNGFFYNRLLNCNDCADYYEEKGVTPRLVFKAGDNGTIDIKAKWSKIDAGAINFNAAFAAKGAALGFGIPDFWQDVNAHVFDYINNIKPVNKQENKQISVKGDWKLDVGTLTAWAAYNDQKNYFLTDGTSAAFGLYGATATCQASLAAEPAAPLPSPTFYAGAASVLPPYSPTSCDGYQYQQRDQKDASVEIRLTSPGDQALRWQGGLYYGDIKRHVVVSQGYDPGTGNLLAQALVPSTGPNPTDLLYDDDFHSKVSAVFGQIAYDVVPNVEVALAARYDREKRSVDNNVPKISPQTAGFGPFGNLICPDGPNTATCTGYINPFYNLPENAALTSIPSRDKTFSKFQPKLSINWKIAEGVSVYTSYGVGFRSGGFNSSGSAATVQTAFGSFQYNGAPQLPVAGVSYNGVTYANGVSDTYKAETSKAFEVGLKAELLDRTLQLGLAAYHTKVDDMQIFNFFAGPFGLLRVVTNVDEATLKGFEGDVKWRASKYVTLFAGIGTVDSKIDKYTGRPYTEGNEVPYAPKYTANAGVDFNIPLAAGLSLNARIDGSSVGKTWFSTVQAQSQDVTSLFGPADYSKTRRDQFTLINARLGLSGDHWNVTAWGRNLSDKKYLAEVIPAPEFGGSFIHSGTGRAFGLDAGYKF
jgi:iron complex outermembrane receptor protein